MAPAGRASLAPVVPSVLAGRASRGWIGGVEVSDPGPSGTPKPGCCSGPSPLGTPGLALEMAPLPFMLPTCAPTLVAAHATVQAKTMLEARMAPL